MYNLVKKKELYTTDRDCFIPNEISELVNEYDREQCVGCGQTRRREADESKLQINNLNIKSVQSEDMRVWKVYKDGMFTRTVLV